MGAVTDRRVLDTVGSYLSAPLLHLFGSPGVHELFELGGSEFHCDPENFVSEFVNGENLGNLKEYVEEFHRTYEEIQSRINVHRGAYPDNFRVGTRSSMALYLLVRLLHPNVVVETGVANGVSTAIVLNAIERNQCGTLFSIDVRSDVGGLLTERERRGWNLIVLKHPLERKFAGAMVALPPIDLFLHDSNHSYRWQKMEYSNALCRLSCSGILLSDDIDASWAFSDVVKGRKLTKVAKLLDSGKMFGGARLGT